MKLSHLKNNYLFPWLVLAVLLLAGGGFITHSLYEKHERLDTQERDRLTTQTRVIEQNLIGQLGGVYRALDDLRKEPHPDGVHDVAAVNRQLALLSNAIPGVRTLFITNRAGLVIAANQMPLIGQDLSYREYFQAPLKGRNTSILYVSPPFKSILGNFVINLTLMIPGPNGEFAGIVTAALDPQYFKTLLGSVQYAPDMWAAIAHGDGKQFLTVPERAGMEGIDLAKPGSFFTRHRDSGRSATVMTGTVYTTGEERMMAQRTIRLTTITMDKPLVVAVGRTLSAMYADWPRQVWGKVAQFTLLALVMAASLYFYQRRQRNFEAISLKSLEELVQSKEEAQRANIAKSRFLATVAHEFRTPLSILTSSTDILDRYSERLNKEERTQQHDRIRNASQQMSDLVDSVLSFNRLGGVSSPNALVLLNIGTFCTDLAEEVSTTCSNGHCFTVSIAKTCGTARLDKILLRRIVENLLTNSFRYTPAGGTVSLQVERENDLLRVVVADSGIGIPKECRQRVFEAFFRCPNIDARRGLGLGLSIVQDALTHMGGTISVDSAVGTGTTMRVEIPLDGPSYSNKEQLPCPES